jgi:hypothetical protein
MKQSRLLSFIESTLSTLSGFGISILAQWLILPLLGVEVTWAQNVGFALVMTALSIGRGFLMRRLFEALPIRRPISPFMHAVIAERYRQIEVEGWDHAHDDKHEAGELARAGGVYATYAYWHLGRAQGIAPAKHHKTMQGLQPPGLWPWSRDWWKPTDFRRDIVKAAALIVADGEKFDRARKVRRKPSPLSEQVTQLENRSARA